MKECKHLKSYPQRILIIIANVCFSMMMLVDNLCAQNTFTWDDLMQQLATEEQIEQPGWEEYLEELEELYAHPININRATKEDLERLQLLTPAQVEAILTYIYRHRDGLKTMGELQLIRELDYVTRQYLRLFFYAGSPEEHTYPLKWKERLKQGKHDILSRLDIPLYRRDGFRSYSDEELLKNPNKIYLGNALYHSLRYQFTAGKLFSAGFSGEKDGGEPFGNRGNWSYDALHAHLYLRPQGFVKALAVGDYRLNFGEGLVVHNGFRMGKSVRRTGVRGIRPYNGHNEYNYLRGGAITLGVKEVSLSAFYSHRKLDATLNDDGSMKTIRTNGYHRTLNELEMKHNVTAQTLGGNLEWRHRQFRLGTTGFYLKFDRPLVPGGDLYRHYYPQGKEFGVLGTNYEYGGYRFHFSGETAYSTERSGWATLNRVSYRFDQNWRLSAVQRFYSCRYHSFYASAFGEESEAQNESGVCVSLEARPKSWLEADAYVDWFHSPWPRYGMNHGSSGVEGQIRLRYTPDKRSALTGRYRVKSKERFNVREVSHRLQTGYIIRCADEKVELRTLALLHVLNNAEKGTSNGYGLVQTAQYRSSKDRLRTAITLGYFHTRDYSSRLYFYEPGLLHSFSYPAYYGQGLRAAVTARWCHKYGTLVLKYGFTHFFDRREQGSGLQRIDSSSKSDIAFQLRLRF